jgi:hypothetical protein
VFYKDIILENYVFAGNNTTVTKWKNITKLGPDHADNPFKKKRYDVIGVCLWWRIGIAGGTRIRDGEVEQDADDLID